MPKNSTPRPTERPPTPAVAVLRWPAQDEERRRLAALGRPRVLVTAAGVTPPSLLDDREVWLEDGCAASRLIDAMAELGRDAVAAPGRPLLDEDGLLRHGGRWVAVPDSQLGVVELLVRNFRRLTPYEDVRAAYPRRGGRQVGRDALHGLVTRLDTRVRTVGLRLDIVRRRGMVLAALDPGHHNPSTEGVSVPT